MAKAPDDSQSPTKPSQLPLGENEALVAIANKNIILEIARAVRSMGDLEVVELTKRRIDKTSALYKLLE